MTMRSTRAKSGCAKSISSSDSGVENSNMRPCWKRRLKPFLRSSKSRSRRAWAVRVRGWRSGNSTYQREPAGSASIRGGDMVHRVALDPLAALRAVGAAGARVQQAQEVVELGGGGDGGARVARGVLLPDGDGRSEAADLVHVRLLHALQELPGVGGERLDVAPLALGVDGVEDQGRLARARNAGDHRQPVVRNVERDVLQVMDPRAADQDEVVHRS